MRSSGPAFRADRPRATSPPNATPNLGAARSRTCAARRRGGLVGKRCSRVVDGAPAASSDGAPASAPRETVGGAAVRARRAVAVLGLQNLSGRGDDVWLATALEEMLTGELGIHETLRVVAAQNIARVKRELMLVEGTTLDGETLVRLRAMLGADLVVLGPI